MLENYKIILGSKSPRRNELLSGLDIKFSIKTSEVDEQYPNTIKGEEIPIYLSKLRADNYAIKSGELLITADTIVYLDGEVYGKPCSKEEARHMLQKLSGNTHEVITGVTITTNSRQDTFASTTKVTFSELTSQEIEYYLDKYKPYDKAGSYGIQEWIGYIGISHIDGSYFNVMGLPVQKLYQTLKTF